jgi:hypothetical protein
MNESTPICCGYKKGFQKKNRILGIFFQISLEKSGFMVKQDFISFALVNSSGKCNSFTILEVHHDIK